MPESQRIFWFCSLALVFALASFLTIHAWHTGVTIDEAASYLMYVNEPWGDSWIAFANTNTLNNHVLNSFVIKLVDLVYPWHEFAMRVPNLLPLLLLPIMMIRARRGDVMTGSHIDLVSSVVGSTLRQGFETQDTTSVKSKFLSLSLIP